MKKIKAFIYTFKNSLVSPSYYKDLFKTNINFSLKYLAMLAVLLSIISTIGLGIRVAPQISRELNSFLNTAKGYYPEDLVVTISENEWFINKSQPYIIPMPEMEPEEDINYEDLPENFITFYKEGTIDDLETFDTLILLNSKNIIIKNQNEIRVNPIENIPDVKIDQNAYEDAISRLSQIIKVFIPVMLLMIFIGLVLYFSIIRALYLFIPALIVWVLVKGLDMKKITFKDAYKVSLHAMTLPLVINALFIICGATLPFVSWFFMLNLLIAIFVVFSLYKKPAKSK